jgi:hypothetical protein
VVHFSVEIPNRSNKLHVPDFRDNRRVTGDDEYKGTKSHSPVGESPYCRMGSNTVVVSLASRASSCCVS